MGLFGTRVDGIMHKLNCKINGTVHILFNTWYLYIAGKIWKVSENFLSPLQSKTLDFFTMASTFKSWDSFQVLYNTDNRDIYILYIYLIRILCEIFIYQRDSSWDISISSKFFVRYSHLIRILCEIFISHRDSSWDIHISLRLRYLYIIGILREILGVKLYQWDIFWSSINNADILIY